MEQWEAIIEHPLEEGHRAFEKLLHTATAVLKTADTHLAPFETEWLMATLLHAPVHLLDTVSRRRGDDAWGKALADAFKLLTAAVEAGVCTDKQYDDIVDVCLLPLDAELRARALSCVTAAARRARGAAAGRLLPALAQAAQCRAPLALLAGALCEHHPAAVCDEVTGVWRGFLSMLDNTKNTDTVTKAVLEGIFGLFKNFGEELPTTELAHFYENLSNIYIHKSACQPACFNILREHAKLFRERLSRDRPLRAALWGSDTADAVVAVYVAVARCVDRTTLQKILTTEVYPHVESPQRLPALRVLASAGTGGLTRYVDVPTLEYAMRERVTHNDAELILWCVEYSQPNSERLLQAAILFYDNLPNAFRKKIVVAGITNSPPDLKRAAVQFLISHSCADVEATVWRDIIEADDVMPPVSRELADCLATALKEISEEEELPPKLSALLRLASKVSSRHSAPLSACFPALVRRRSPDALAAARLLATYAADVDTDAFYKSLRLAECRDEAALHEASLTLIHSPEHVDVDPVDMLWALQIIFSSDVEPKIHITALEKFDFLLTNDKCLDVDTCDTIRAVEKLRSSGDRTDREIRILHREATLFLGKHGNVDLNNNRDGLDDAIIVDLKKSLTLTLPHQGTSYKMDLKTLLLFAVQHEDPNALQTFLSMLCANPSCTREASTRRGVLRGARALAGAHAAGRGAHAAAVLLAARHGACAPDMLQYISSAKSCGVRKLLSTALAALCEDPDTLQLVVERTGVMLASSESMTKRAGLDIAETIITSLENNNYLTKTILPELMVSIANTYEINTKTTLDIASKTFIDKQELFDKKIISKTVFSLLENALKTHLSDVSIYKTIVKTTVEFMKNLRDVKLNDLLEAMFDICKTHIDVKVLYVFAVFKSVFSFDNEMSRMILGRENSVLVSLLLNSKCDRIEREFEVEVVLKFLEEYCEVFLELKYQETLQFISNIITTLTPALIKQLHKNIKMCFDSLNRNWKDIPKLITISFQSWVETLPIKKITDAIDNERFLAEHKLSVEALKIMSNVFDIRQIILSDVKQYIRQWPSILLKLYSSGRLEDYFFNEISYFTVILSVSLKFLTSDAVKTILKSNLALSNKQNTGILFCGLFIQAFFEILTDTPFILLDDDLKECSVLLNDIVRLTVKKASLKERQANVLELVNMLWPTYEHQSTFDQKHCLLTSLERLGPSPESNPLQWATRAACARDAPLENRLKLLAVVPEEAYKLPEVMSAASSLFPARLSELRPALLDAVEARASALAPLVALAANDPTKGWWDTALESCLAAVAKQNNLELCTMLYSKCQSGRVCERILVPLLRHSSTEVCEKFLATVLDKILASLNKKPKGDAHAGYQKCLDDYMVHLHLLLLAFEKLPTSSLESPASVLYRGCRPPVPAWHLVRSGCKLCDTLRDLPRPADRLVAMYREFQCVLYNCLCAGICRRRPGAALYAQLFSVKAFEKIDDQETQYELPIRPSWTQRNKLLPVAVPLEPTSLSLSHTQRSRIFLRTLSEDPMLFDLHSTQEEVMEVQDISLRDTPLNAHPCAATLSALFRHAAPELALAGLWPGLGAALRHVPRLPAQIICNCKEDLKPLAGVLLPGLLAFLTDTVDADRGMHGLHIDVLDTIIYWKEDTTENLSTIAHHLITTCMQNRIKNVFDGLLKTLHGFLELYGSCVRIEWKSFEKYYEDQNKDTQAALLKVIKVILKLKMYVPELLLKLESKLSREPARVAECFGLAAAACARAEERGAALGALRRRLRSCDVITSYVRMLYYAVLGCPECCGELEFRKITDYVTKVTSQDRTKCLHILSAYLSRGHSSQYVTDMFDTADPVEMLARDHAAMLVVKNGLPAMSDALKRRCVAQIAALKPEAKGRGLVVDVMLRVAEDLLAQPMQPPAKRQKTDTTPILSLNRDDAYNNSVLTCLGLGAVDTDDSVSKVARDALGAKMDKDLGARFADCFLLCVYLPAHSDTPPSVCVCVSALLEMLYSDMRAAESFKNCRLRDEPLAMRETEGVSKLLTLSKTFQGTFSSYSLTRGRIRTTQDTNKPAIDVQVSIDSVLESLLEFAKVILNLCDEHGYLFPWMFSMHISPEASRALLTEALRAVLSGSKFDLPSTLVPLLGSLLRREPTQLTPLYIDVCRVLLANGNCDVLSLMDPVEKLKKYTAGTEGAALARLLHEEVSMRCVRDMFELGRPVEIDDVAMDETSAFSIEDLKFAFGKLSDWDDLTLQERGAFKNSGLPPIWTDRGDFITHLDSYEVPADASSWFDKMAAAFKQQSGSGSLRWLRKVDQWPRRHFEISAITEAASWRREEMEVPPPTLFRVNECLVEWAARLMLRSAYHNSLQNSATDEDSMIKLSRSHELKWCARANEMEIPSIALQCVDRNVEELCESETLPWLRQKLVALRLQARHDTLRLRDALRKAEEYTPEYSIDPSVSIEMHHLMLLLHNDLKSLTHHELQSILAQVDRSSQQVDWSTSPKRAVSSVYEIAMAHYDGALDEGAIDTDTALPAMSSVFCRAAALGASADLLPLLLRRLDAYEDQLEADAGRELLEQLTPLAATLDPFTVELLEKNAHKFPSHLQKSLQALFPKDGSTERYRRCLQLVCDPDHLLRHYCEELQLALGAEDAAAWKSILDRARDKIYDNPFAGPSYKLLDKYKADLYGMYEFEPTPEFTSQAKEKLNTIMAAVNKKPQPTLHLADLCPALLRLAEQTSAAKWLGLSARVVKFYDKVQVFTDSIRRPVVLSMLLSNGRTHRAIQKSGERLANDAAAQRVAACARLRGASGAYAVTLLDKESALIEYLEGHERLRALIGTTCDLNAVLVTSNRPGDRNLIESQAAAMQAHDQLCGRVPAHALRSAVEQNSSCVQDFIHKKRNFTDSLAAMTVLTWLLGVDDRHLENIMCSRDGHVLSVDWGDVFRRADPPARLTRNLLALADTRVLEARLQSILTELRDSAPRLEACVWAAFHWMGPSLERQLGDVRGILRGVTSSRRVSRDVIARGDARSKEMRLQLLDRALAEFVEREEYSVEEQVSCLLRHCTSPEILSVTRAGWEPWV